MKNPMELTGKHVLVTGGSSGIGRATARLCAELGARVSLVARREEELRRAMKELPGEGHAWFACDLAQLAGIEAFAKELVAQAGPLDGLVHAAGFGENRPIAISKPEFVLRTMEVNYFAFVELVRVLAKKKTMNDGASIVAVSSVASLRGDKTQGAYAAAKAALNGVIHPMAKELAGRGIRANTVALGMVATGMYEAFQAGGGNEEALAGQYLGVAAPEDAANVICFLLSPASRFVTGSTLAADGGYLS